MLTKTNAARALDRLGITYVLRDYRADPDDLSPERLSVELGMAPETIYKTLVARAEPSGLLFAVIALARELDLKALARAAKAKRIELLARSQLMAATGYVRGSVTALAARKPLPVYLDDACLHLAEIGVSAGAPGRELVLAPADYIRATGAIVAPICLAAGQLCGTREGRRN